MKKLKNYIMREEPKEKATKLVKKFFNEITDHMTWEQAKECALIVANECIDETESTMWWKYWIDVNDAIKAL